jgi:hypothetical protein
VLRYIYVASMAEGWGLYSERLADEMGLYSSDVDRLGMLSGQAFRAARLVVDPGLHVMGWTREQAITYMVEHSVEARAYIETEIDRYLAVPGQATAYMTGSLEIQTLRRDAERQLGTRFDIKSFHDVVLRDGAVTLPMLQKALARWVGERRRSRTRPAVVARRRNRTWPRALERIQGGWSNLMPATLQPTNGAATGDDRSRLASCSSVVPWCRRAQASNHQAPLAAERETLARRGVQMCLSSAGR